jgi:hypothetical protein
MTFLTDTPYTSCYIRNEFFYDETKGHGEFTEAYVFGFRAEPARVPMFQVMCNNGAQWARVPIHMIVSKPCEVLPLNITCWWDSFSRHCTVHEFSFLRNHSVNCYGRDKVLRHGNYLFTIDWATGGFSETSDQHKNHHVIVLDTGQWIAYPNNKCLWVDPSHIKEQPRFDWISPSKSYSVEV